MHSKIKYSLLLAILFFLLPQNTSQSTPASLYYVGAVVEYHPMKGNLEAVAVKNVDNYITIIKKAKELNSNLDIIVFPETGILADSDEVRNKSEEELRKLYASAASYVPNPPEKVTPCGDNNTKVSKTLETLSCAAKQYQTYVVVNYFEKEDCKNNCAKDNLNLYNSNIIFDRTGTIISRYRKYNLFVEPNFNVTSEPELSTFETDFGVKFGQFICFDIMFESPALELLKKLQITDIVYPLHWFGELPFLDALEVQTAWSYTNNVNLLASGYNNPSTGSTGSGIFAGTYDKIPGVFRSETNKNALLIANIPKVKDGVRSDVKNETILYEFSDAEVSTLQNKTTESSFWIDFLSSFTTTLVEPEVDQFLTLCKDDFCCYFNHKAEYNQTVVNSGKEYYRYRFGAFAGVRYFGTVTLGVQVCGLLTCTSDSLSSCGHKFDANDIFIDWVTFQKLEITTLAPRKENVTLLNLPVTLQTNFMPLNPSDFSFKSIAMKDVDYDFLSLSLRGSQKNLMAFGIYGRNFSADGDNSTTIPSSASSDGYSLFVISVVAILILLGFQDKIYFF